MSDPGPLVTQYAVERHRYEEFGQCLTKLISQLLDQNQIRPHTITSRAKTTDSLRNKLNIKKYQALSDITDLTGARIVLYFQDEVDTVLTILRSNFEINYVNSSDKRERANSFEFGYRSFHYILSLTSERTKLPEYKSYLGLKAEVQVRSILDHAWAEIQHDGLGYKADKAVPRQTQRALAKAAALLETADEMFADAKKHAFCAAQELLHLRTECITELVPNLAISVQSAIIAEAQRSYDSVGLSFQTNITNVLDANHNFRGVTMVTSSPSCRGPMRGIFASYNSVIFPRSMPGLLTPTERSVQFTVSGIRLCAGQMDAGNLDLPSMVYCCLFAYSADGEMRREDLATQEVAAVFRSCKFLVRPADRDQRDGAHQSPIKPIGIVEFRELFRDAFRSTHQESGGPLDPASSGTRLVVRFHDIPAGLQLFADIQTRGIAARLTVSDMNGGGTFDPVPKANDIEGHDVAPIVASTYRGGAQMVWEVVEQHGDSSAAEATIYALTSAELPEQVLLTGMLGPTSTISTCGCNTPIPRFISDPQAAVLRLRAP